MPPEGLKQRFRTKEQVLGLTIPANVERDQLEQLLQRGPYDFVMVDSQHSPFNEERLVSLSALVAEAGTFLHLRIKHTRHTYLIGNYLDLGPRGIEVPQVETEASAVEAVDNFYYLPAGKRSVGGGARPRAKEFSDPFAYAEWWNNYGILWMQVESVEATEQVYALAKPGVDCVSFGPTDLSFSLKYSNHPRLKTVDDCVAQVVETLEGTETAVCFRSFTPAKRQKYLDMGVTVILEHFQQLD